MLKEYQTMLFMICAFKDKSNYLKLAQLFPKLLLMKS